MNTSKLNNLNMGHRIGVNHEKQPSLFLWGVDCVDAECGFTKDDLNNFIEFLEEQRDILNTRDAQQKWLFGRQEHFETIKDVNNATKEN